jgi:hypothetical protein
MSLKDYYVSLRKKSDVLVVKHVIAESEDAAICLAEKNSPTFRAFFARLAMVSDEEWQCIPVHSRSMLNLHCQTMRNTEFDARRHPKRTDWHPLTHFDGFDSQKELKVLTRKLSLTSNFQTHMPSRSSGDTHETIYIYDPAAKINVSTDNDQIQYDHLSFIIYFSIFAPIAALGMGSWSETLSTDGVSKKQTHELLKPESLISFSSVETCAEIKVLIAALSKTSYVIAEPSYLRKNAPNWFGPTPNNKRDKQQDTLFDLLYQSYFQTVV